MTTHTAHYESTSTDLCEVLAQLQANRDAIPWPQRRQIVTQIAGPLAEGMAGDPFRALLLLLAEDSKWEVRRDVAEALGSIPDNDLAAITEKMVGDSHAYVQRAAKQSIMRRRKLVRDSQKRKRGVELVSALYQELEDDHGKPAADKARHMAEQLYDTLIGVTVHEMRSVLTALKEDNAQIIERDGKGQLEPEFLRRKSLKIANRLLFMERLLLDMRNYSQPVSDERVTVSVADLITEARSIVSENLKALNLTPWHPRNPQMVTLNVSIPGDMKVKVSRVHIVTAIVNVLRNAYDFLPIDKKDSSGRGRIHVRASLKERLIHIEIQDNGMGIPADSLDEVRQCLPGRTSRRNVGTGFGLCNVRRFVEAHGGRLQIDSKENQGTTVTLVLPSA